MTFSKAFFNSTILCPLLRLDNTSGDLEYTQIQVEKSKKFNWRSYIYIYIALKERVVLYSLE